MAEIDVQQSLLDDIKEFINEKWKHSECELCGTDRWMIYPEPATYAYIAIGDDGGPPRFPQPRRIGKRQRNPYTTGVAEVGRWP